MDYGISSLFTQLLHRYGLALSLVVTVTLVAIYLMMRYFSQRIESQRSAEEFDRSERAKDTARKETRDQAFLAELKAARDQNMRIVEQHLANDRVERDEVVKALAQLSVTQETLVEAIRDMRQEHSLHHEALQERLSAIHLDVSRSGRPH